MSIKRVRGKGNVGGKGIMRYRKEEEEEICRD